jgi:hypothetical protein
MAFLVNESQVVYHFAETPVLLLVETRGCKNDIAFAWSLEKVGPYAGP